MNLRIFKQKQFEANCGVLTFQHEASKCAEEKILPRTVTITAKYIGELSVSLGAYRKWSAVCCRTLLLLYFLPLDIAVIVI